MSDLRDRFRLTASDRKSNEPDAGTTGARILSFVKSPVFEDDAFVSHFTAAELWSAAGGSSAPTPRSNRQAYPTQPCAPAR